MKGKFAGTRAQFLMTHIFSQRAANGASIDVSCLFVAQERAVSFKNVTLLKLLPI